MFSRSSGKIQNIPEGFLLGSLAFLGAVLVGMAGVGLGADKSAAAAAKLATDAVGMGIPVGAGAGALIGPRDSIASMT